MALTNRFRMLGVAHLILNVIQLISIITRNKKSASQVLNCVVLGLRIDTRVTLTCILKLCMFRPACIHTFDIKIL